MSKLPFFLFSSLLASTSALAFDADQRCTAQPSCESMGYSKSAKTGCSQIIKCPFDLSYTLCLDCSNSEIPNTCPAGKTPLQECEAKGGIGLANTFESVNGTNCVTCQTCDQEDYSMTLISKSNGMTCLNETYTQYNGGKFQCCTGCSDGKMTEEQCSAQNGVIQKGTLNSDTGCGECLTCDGTLYKRGTFSKIPESYGCTTLNYYSGSGNDADLCCKPCESYCPTGSKYITSANEITSDVSSYCLGADITLSNSTNLPSNTTFYENVTCAIEPKLTIEAINAHKKTITSHAYTIINGGDVGILKLHRGGEIKKPMNCGTYTVSGHECRVSGGNCELWLDGEKDYYFSARTPSSPNLPSIVSCSLVAGGRLVFQEGAPNTSGYLFSGSDGITIGDTSCSLGKANNSCKATTCTIKDIENKTTIGKIKDGNMCE